MAATFPDDTANRLARLCAIELRTPYGVASDDLTGEPILTFTPPLTAGEQVVFDRLAKLALSLVEGITPAEWEAIEPDIAGLATYQGLANPTLAQTVLAVKAQSRILRALIRN